MTFSMRTSKPAKGNKFYNTKSNGGYSTCIVGKPTDVCNVLANCVGYACGRFNEIIGSMKYPSLNCNAENFIERAKSAGLSIVSYPTLGGIMVWQKGSTLGDSDGAGHVAVVERIDSANQIYTSESGYGSTAFYNAVRSNSNGRWGLGSAYKFRGCIVNPAIGDVHYTESSSNTTNEFAHAIGETVTFTTCYTSSSNAANMKNYIPASKMLRTSGKITKRLKVRNSSGTLVSVYLLDNGLCWVNDGDIKGANSNTSSGSSTTSKNKYKVGDVVKINRVYISSTSTAGLTPDKTSGTITKILEGVRNPYLLNNGNIGWVNDNCIIGLASSTMTARQFAMEVWYEGKHGTGATRKDNAEKLGVNYNEAQKLIDILASGGKI